MFLVDLFLKQQTAGAEPALQIWENQQCAGKVRVALSDVQGCFPSMENVLQLQSPFLCTDSLRAHSGMCHSGMHPWPLLPCPARLHMLFGEQKELPTLALAVPEWQWNLQVDDWKTDGEPVCGWEVTAPSARYKKQLPKYLLVQGWRLADGLKKEGSTAGGCFEPPQHRGISGMCSHSEAQTGGMYCLPWS